jgi:hypothetical protein
MSQTHEFYTARAEEAAAEAQNAALDNVRERALRSEAAWRQMADRLIQVETQREIADQVRKERREAEQLATGQIRAEQQLVEAQY